MKTEEQGRQEAGFSNHVPLPVPTLEASSPNKDKQAALEDFLRALSDNQTLDEDDVHRSIDFLKLVYTEVPEGEPEFRHSYSSIFEIMVGEYNPDAKEPDYEPNLTTTQLATNIDLLQTVIEEDGDETLNRKFCKLRDHVELESKRINYIVRQNRLQHETSNGDSRRMGRELESFRFNLKRATDGLSARIEEREKQIDRMQREYIAILGILAAVVIAANGGIVFSSASIQALAGQNVFYLAFIVSIVGAFLFNLLFALFTFLYRMVRLDGGYWGVLSKEVFIRINKWIVAVLALFLVISCLVSCVESGFFSNLTSR